MTLLAQSGATIGAILLAMAVVGLEGFDDAPTQTVMGLLSLPFRGRSERSRSRVGGSDVPARTEPDQNWLR